MRFFSLQATCKPLFRSFWVCISLCSKAESQATLGLSIPLPTVAAITKISQFSTKAKRISPQMLSKSAPTPLLPSSPPGMPCLCQHHTRSPDSGPQLSSDDISWTSRHFLPHFLLGQLSSSLLAYGKDPQDANDALPSMKLPRNPAALGAATFRSQESCGLDSTTDPGLFTGSH